MFLISKIFWLVAQPLSFSFFAALAGLLATAAGLRRIGGFLGAFGALVLFVCLFTTAGPYALQTLEDRFTRPSPPPATLSCIVVLGGAFENEVMAGRGGTEFNQAADRFIETVALAKRYPEARILVSGGDGSFSGAYAGDAAASESFLAAFDIGGERLLREEQSRTTFENARNTKELLAANGLSNCALVTSAFHIPRSVGLFRALDIPVVPWPTDYRTSGRLGLGLDFTQPSLNAQLTTTAVREWIGLLAYRLAGRTPSILPAP
ncbi:YdcF family protein [Ensifer adhaerens]|uniref:YdcF family protein n=1 Tax=Ensifer adhaerens TaxID=106592 RepID=UPI0023A924D6|nr:YdcF family protein [Ensifer adhaerens]WDZ76744.1 YdcF family protein [Ensifer adhaerens]